MPGNHKSKECNNEIVQKCINCVKENWRFNLGLDEDHATFNREYPVYQNGYSVKNELSH